ncbi:MAG: hypothetical protein ACTSVU_01740 [Promethearchaeota archaeon]
MASNSVLISNFQPQNTASKTNHHKHKTFLDTRTGDLVCLLCGEVLDQNMIAGELSQTFLTLQDNRRNIRFSSSSPSAIQLKRALIFERKIKPWSKKKIDIGSAEIRRICSKLEISKQIEEYAKNLFQKAIKLQHFKNHYINLIALISIFYSSRKYKYPIEWVDILRDQDYSIHLAQKYYLSFVNLLKLSRLGVESSMYIPQICANLDLDEIVMQKSSSILQFYLKKRNTSGFKNKGIVAGIIYLSCKILSIPRNQKEIGRAAGISEATVRIRYKEIYQICRKFNYF